MLGADPSGTAPPVSVAGEARASGEERWALFEPVCPPEIPAVRASGWVRNPVDAFIAREHEARGLSPVAEASRATLLRRVYLDLIGLPPTPEEMHAFLEDASPRAYEAVVERLLASPHYGERWARHWMDIWRYADANYDTEKVNYLLESHPHVWRWRDWIVESLNRDKGFDRMIVEMLAGDELAPDDPATVRGTGYLACNHRREYVREVQIQNAVDGTFQAFLGVTLGCARCHDHKYDPLTKADYYRVQAIFEPHRVRVDRIPGVVDRARDGLARAYDADPDAPTYVSSREEGHDDTDPTIGPGIPEALGGSSFPIHPVELPRGAFAPDARPFVVADDIREARAWAEGGARAERARAGREYRASKGRLASALRPAPGRRTLVAHLGTLQKSLTATIEASARFDLARKAEEVAGPRYRALEATVEAQRLEDAGAGAEATRAAARAARFQKALAGPEAEYRLLEARLTYWTYVDGKNSPALAEAWRQFGLVRADAHRPPGTSFARLVPTTYPARSTGRRLALARWIADRSNPLTARVAVNHIWLRHFGQALVSSVSDFGRNGSPPSHPELLDWLAAEFMAGGWSMKAIHRLIVTSSTYRLSSAANAPDLAIDPGNTFLWRMAPRRLEAEVIRDQVLYVSGGLDPSLGGPPLPTALGLTAPRRSLYLRQTAVDRVEFLSIFNGPAGGECYVRDTSVLPQQALALSNSELTWTRARLLARALEEKDVDAPRAFARAAFERVLARPPRPEELSECARFLETSVENPPGKASGPARPTDARTMLVHALMNHYEFAWVR